MTTIQLIGKLLSEPFVTEPTQAFKEIQSFVQLKQYSFVDGKRFTKTPEYLARLVNFNFSQRDIKKAKEAYAA